MKVVASYCVPLSSDSDVIIIFKGNKPPTIEDLKTLQKYTAFMVKQTLRLNTANPPRDPREGKDL